MFILGELMDQPLHGYLLRDIINLTIGPTRQMSWGGLYPLIRRLEEEGLIEQVEDAEASGARPRKSYRITGAGRSRFLDLMLRPEEYNSDYPDLFNIKLGKFDYLSKEQQLGILERYQGFVQFLKRHLEEGQHYVADHLYIPETERPHVLRAIAHRAHLAAADLGWIEEEIARLNQNFK